MDLQAQITEFFLALDRHPNPGPIARDAIVKTKAKLAIEDDPLFRAMYTALIRELEKYLKK